MMGQWQKISQHDIAISERNLDVVGVILLGSC